MMNDRELKEYTELQRKVRELQDKLEAVREVIAEKLMMEWATHSGEPPTDVKNVLEDVRKAALNKGDKK